MSILTEPTKNTTMKQRISLLSLLLIISVALFYSCENDIVGDVEVTYEAGTPIYGDMETIRNTPLLEASRDLTNPGKIFVSPNFLFIGEEGVGIHIIDNTDPEAPRNLAFLNIPGNREYFVSNNILYAESYYDMLKIDLSIPTQPVLVSRIENAVAEEIQDNQGRTLLGFEFQTITEKLDKDDNIWDFMVGNDHQVYFDYAQQMIPPSAVPASFAGNSSNGIGSVNRVVENNGYVYMVSRQNLIIIDDRSSFSHVSTNSIGWDMETVYPLDDLLFIGASTNVTVMNVSDPENPEWVSSFQHITSCDPVIPSDIEDISYVTLRTGDENNCPGDENALLVLQMEDGWMNPIQEIGMESPYGLTLIGDKLYVGEGMDGLKIFDATDRRRLVLEEWNTSVTAYDVLQHPTRNDILLIAGPDGLDQVKIEGFEELSTIPF